MSGEWMAQLSDDLKGNEALTSFENLSDLATAHLENVGKLTDLDGRATKAEGEKTDLEGRLADSIPKLGENPTEAEITAFRNALGIPETADKYEFPKAEGVQHDETTTEWAREMFHAAGLTVTQAAAISQGWDKFTMEVEKAELAETVKAEEEARVALKKEWGAGFEENMKFIKRGWKHFTDSDLDMFMKESGLGNHPLLLKFMLKVGTAMGEDFIPAATPHLGKGDKAPGMGYETMEQFKRWR